MQPLSHATCNAVRFLSVLAETVAPALNKNLLLDAFPGVGGGRDGGKVEMGGKGEGGRAGVYKGGGGEAGVMISCMPVTLRKTTPRTPTNGDPPFLRPEQKKKLPLCTIHSIQRTRTQKPAKKNDATWADPNQAHFIFTKENTTQHNYYSCEIKANHMYPRRLPASKDQSYIQHSTRYPIGITMIPAVLFLSSFYSWGQ